MLTIGKLSEQTSVKIETIRYYEKIGMMPDPPRKASGHRTYTRELVDRLRFIRRGRELGFSLNDIRGLLGVEDNSPTCAEVHELTKTHLDTIRSKITDLRKLEKTLTLIADKCERGQTPDCPIIDALARQPT